MSTANFKPRQGRQNLAHGASRGLRARPLPPSPLPRRAGEGEQKGVGRFYPGLAPWATIFRPYRG